ncbi:MAG: hypothetical protein HC890_17010, partial [Chloroflexaceae bacterium]|nr:hypothetical protein [Chloroflexaceae bacterium]
ALPNTRQELSHLLRNIEETGGWPYIERMRLQEFLGTFLSEGEAENLEQIPEEWPISSAGRAPQQPTSGS